MSDVRRSQQTTRNTSIKSRDAQDPVPILVTCQPKLSAKQQAELRRMHASGDYSIADLAELFTVSRPTVYRTLQRSPASPAR